MIILSRGSLGQTGRFKPDTFALNLAERGSTATLTIQKIFAPDLIVGDWLQDDTDPGSGIVWRVKTIDTQYDRGLMTIQLEDLINSLNDTLLNGEVKPSDIAGPGATTCTARQAVEYILARQANWVLGSFDYGSVSNPYNFNGDSLKAALDTVSSSLEDPVWSYDFSTHPFTLNITHESAAVACEMRMDRNISTMRVTVDKSRMYTRFYPIGKKNLRLDMPGYVQKNVETWGAIEKTETDESKDTKEKLLAWANERLNVHADPMVTVTIGGLDLSEQTGEDLDNLKLSRKCRVPLPRYSTTITEKITKLAWRDKLAEPRNVTVTMANQQEDIASIINRMNKSSGSGGRAKAKDEEEDHAWMVDTTDHIGLVAEAVAGEGADVDWSIVASVMVDGKGVHQRVTETEGELVTAFSAIEATSTNIYLQVGSARSDLTSYIEQTKSSIMSSVYDSVNDLHSEIMETQSMIRSAVWTANSTIYTYINQTASYILDHVGDRSGSKVIPGMDEPQDTPDNPTVFSDETKFKKAEQGEDETETISIPVKVTLKSVKEKQEGEDPTTPNSIDEPEGWEFDYNDITWAGSADTYHKCDEETITDEAGTVLIKKLLPGTYTVKEMLTEAQQKRYITPEPQTKEMGEAANGVEPEPMIFEMTNEDKPVPVVLKKTNAKEGGVVDGFEFTLTGKRGYDDADIDVSGVTQDGSIEFGNLYTGEYILEETSFDPEIYMFHKKYKLKGHDKPAIAISLVTDDDGNWTADLSTGEKLSGKKGDTLEIGFENDPITNLLITKVDTDTRLFLEDAEFDLYEGDKKTASFRLVLGEEGRAAAEIFWKDEDSTIFTDNQPIPDDGAEMPEPSVVDEDTPDNGSNTSSSNNASNSDGNVTTMADTTEPADGGNDTAGDGSGDSEAGTTEDVQYNYAILKGLKRHTEYRIVETKNPKGHTGDIDYGFTFEEDMEPLIFENKQPEISTTATDSKTDQHMSNATEGPVTIIDTVEYKGLTPGKEYTMTGRLVFKPRSQDEEDTASEDINVVKSNGKAVEKTVTFTPKEKDGTVDVELTFDAKDLEGARTVIFESLGDPALDVEDTIIATHSEIDNEDQSIYFPEVHTSAKAEDTNMNITGANEETTIIDTVEYSNVIAGKVYEMKGTLMSKETGKPIKVDGEPVTASVKFKATENGPDYNDLTEDEQAATTPEQPAEQPAEGQEDQEGQQADDANKVKLVSGSVELTFTFDSTEFAGDSLVAFEELYSKGKLVGQHKNINDKKQTVRIPIIGTKASAGRNVIKDKVAYKNLIPGKRYIMRGVMMNKKTGEPMTIDGEELESELEFTPKKSSGIVTLEFEVNTKKLKGKTLVAFEKCFVITDESGEEVEIAAHENLDSKAQTVTFRTPQTGQVLPWFIFAALAAMVISAGYMLRKKFLLK